jgi:hypothetical protein
MPDAYRVFVVLDRSYGERLSEVAKQGPVWIVDTPANRKVAETNPNRDHLNGITTFKSRDGISAENVFINELATIDLHHGTYSANPPYTVIEVIGAVADDKVKAALSEFGFDQFEVMPEGFRAVRPIPSDNERE